MAEAPYQFDGPSAVTAGPDPDDHIACERRMEAADTTRFMVQFPEVYLTVGRVAGKRSVDARGSLHHNR